MAITDPGFYRNMFGLGESSLFWRLSPQSCALLWILNPCKNRHEARGRVEERRRPTESVLVISHQLVQLIKTMRGNWLLTWSSGVTSSLTGFHNTYSLARCICQSKAENVWNRITDLTQRLSRASRAVAGFHIEQDVFWFSKWVPGKLVCEA